MARSDDTPWLTLEDATIELIAAVDATPADESVEGFNLGTYSPSVGGGHYWTLTTSRVHANAGNNSVGLGLGFGEPGKRASIKRQILAESRQLANEADGLVPPPAEA